MHAVKDLINIGLTLGTTDDLTNAGEEHVHSANGLAVLVLFHIEGLDLLWVVG